ncbi:MAG: rod shape-determining protein [Hyphomonadaceae bacterium]|nr:rod shape-determining protein [Hyphomonadaceae bacterium]MBY0565258.1 rod shape-determining protein [Hyphomonadaceae bacterium]
MAGCDRSWSIGVDFGTAFSKAAATEFLDGRLTSAAPLALGDVAGWGKPFWVPSVLFLDGERLHFGPEALARFAQEGHQGRELAQSLKMMLGAHSYQETLNYHPRSSVDPDRIFRVRELLVLYLGYLLGLVEKATAQTISDERQRVTASIRFCRPGWLPDHVAAAHEVMVALFEQAHGVNQELGDQYGDKAGLSYEAARQALAAVLREGPRFPRLDGGIYEASAVALCHFNDAHTPDRMVIVDIGAGTTDVAGLVKEHADGEIRVVRHLRRTIDVAGDHLDAALLNLLVSRAPTLRSKAERQTLWRRLSADVRDLKERLFAEGSLSIVYAGRQIGCKASDLEQAPAFRDAVSQIARLCELCVRDLANEARQGGSKRVGVLVTGGGAHVPALQKAVRALPRRVAGIAVEHLTQAPEWFGALAGASALPAVFAQLSPACGAALSRGFAGAAVAARP